VVPNIGDSGLKKVLLACVVFLCALCGFANPMSGDEILALVRSKLPDDPLKLTGSLKVKERNGYTRANLPVEMELDWGASPATARYQIDNESLDIAWKGDVPQYRFSNAKNQPASDILGTGITWADLSFSVLWWPGAKLIDEARKINRECYVVDVPVPGSENTMRLWIEKNMGMLLEAQTLDAKKKQLRRMKIKSIKKMDGMWVAKDLELTDKKSGSKTTLQISDLKWKDPKPMATAFDPAASVNELSVALYKELMGKDGNLFLSPYSISSALAMVYAGARGETAEQMNSTLYFGGQGATHPAFSHLRKIINGIQDKGQVQLIAANSLWPQIGYAFLPDYLALSKEFYDTEITGVDFKNETEAARIKINNWVETKTRDRIKNIIAEGMLDSMTRLVLANAIYFKGSWASQFKKEATREAPFSLQDGSSVSVPMMHQTGDFGISFGKDFQALKLPYEGTDLSMVMLLPSAPDGLPALEQSLTPELLAGLKFNEQEVFVQLPKFKMERKFELSSMFAEMGMPLAFTDRADFSGMDGSQNLSIGVVVHKAFIEVNEEGTEAAAATAVGMRVTSMPPMFEANRPFLFLIRENSTGMILFIGRVTDPR
jgi:serpin B